MSEETPCKYCGHWPDPADDFAYVAVCNGQTFCAEPVCKGKCYQCRIATQQVRIDELEAAIETDQYHINDQEQVIEGLRGQVEKLEAREIGFIQSLREMEAELGEAKQRLEIATTKCSGYDCCPLAHKLNQADDKYDELKALARAHIEALMEWQYSQEPPPEMRGPAQTGNALAEKVN